VKNQRDRNIRWILAIQMVFVIFYIDFTQKFGFESIWFFSCLKSIWIGWSCIGYKLLYKTNFYGNEHGRTGRYFREITFIE